jgi:hypothetical protein
MRAIITGVLSIIVLLAPCEAEELPRNAAQLLLQRAQLLSCRKIYLGNFSWAYDPLTLRPSGPGVGGDGVNSLEQTTLDEESGIVDVQLVGQLNGGMGKFFVVLRYPVDERFFVQKGKEVCFQTGDWLRAKVVFTGSDEVKGARTGWSGVIAHAQVTGVQCIDGRPELKRKCTNNPDQEFLLRVLYKKLPLGDEWSIVASDNYKDGRFSTDYVPNALTQD